MLFFLKRPTVAEATPIMIAWNVYRDMLCADARIFIRRPQQPRAAAAANVAHHPTEPVVAEPRQGILFSGISIMHVQSVSKSSANFFVTLRQI